MIKRLLFILYCCFTLLCAHAQNGYQPTETDSSDYYENLDEDSDEDITGDTGVVIRKSELLPDSIASWKANKKFAYAKNLDSMLEALQRKQSKRKVKRDGPSLDNVAIAGWIRFILWALAGLVVIYILYQLFLNKGIFKGRSMSKKVSEEATEDELYLQQDFDQLIHQACRLGDYRVATRYLFLKTLQRLSDRSLIEFSIDKTNSKYVREIPSDKREDFAGLVLNYEYIWYGNSRVDKELYTGLETRFNVFLNKI